MEAFLENMNFQMVYTGLARWALVALAVYIGKTRLIDNFLVEGR